MSKSQFRFHDSHHSFYLHGDEEKRFIQAIVKRNGRARGYVTDSCREAIMDWVKKIDAEQ